MAYADFVDLALALLLSGCAVLLPAKIRGVPAALAWVIAGFRASRSILERRDTHPAL